MIKVRCPQDIINFNNFFSNFEVIHQLSLSLNDKDRSIALKNCERIQDYFNKMHQLTEQEVDKLENKAKISEEELLHHRTESTRLSDQLKKTKDRIANLEIELAECNSKITSIDKEIIQIKNELSNLNKKIEEEKEERTDALTDVIPFFGLIRGIQTGRPLRGIPFYSQINAVVSLAKQNVENARKREKRFNEEMNNLVNSKGSIQIKIEVEIKAKKLIEIQIDELRKKREVSDKKIKKSGEKLTIIREVHLQMNSLKEEFYFLIRKVDRIEVFANKGLPNTTQVIQFQKKLDALKGTIQKINY